MKLAGASTAAAHEARVLQERAARLARPAASAAQAADGLLALEFVVAGQDCLLELEWLRQVEALRELAPVPLAPAALLGLQAWRGRMLPVLDLALLLGRVRADGSAPKRLLVLGRQRALLALAVDAVQGLQPVAPAEAESRSKPLEGLRPDIVRGVTPDGRLLLSGPRLLDLHRSAGA